MNQKVKILGIGVLFVAVALAASLVSYVSDARAQSTHPEHGPWILAGDGSGGGYLVNTTTGEVWRLRDNVKLAVREVKQESRD